MMDRNLTLLTDLYQLTMMNGYFLEGKKDQRVIFDVFFRQNELITYSVTAGLEQVIDYLKNLKFTQSDIEYLKGLNLFDKDFLKHLESFRFTGDVFAMPEGTVVFPGEPILSIRSNIIEAQLVETAILNILNHQTLIATKAAKVCYAAKGGSVLEFGLRRAQGPDAGFYGARASIIGGCSSTSNVLAGKSFGVKVSGTHAHSWVMNFPTELEAFRAYARIYPSAVLLLVDTYDTLNSGIPNAITVFKECRERGFEPVGIRLDSGDLAYLTKKARKMLDEAGFPNAKICASGDLDEYLITSLKNQGAKIDIWGVGTKLITSEDMPALGGVYKLSAVYENGKIIPKIKLSDNRVKITNPGFKTVYRIYDIDGMAQADLIALRGEVFDESKPLTIFHPVDTWKKMTFEPGSYKIRELVTTVMEDGELVNALPTLAEISEYAKREKESFWDEYKRLDRPQYYKVDLSDGLYELKKNMINKIRNGK
ncbi:MAG: nicotinate phosphoribosyltransferase [Clostridia bacterium]|nr:nicotinate phosphoribosyltransferase [Clostridia bacterium]